MGYELLFGGSMYSIGGLTFQKRKKLTINNNSGSTLTNYQVMVTVTYDSDMKSTFDDIRFAYPNNTLIDFWLESKTDSTTANFWVEVDLPNYGATPTGDNYIYMYYGNPSAASASNVMNTFIREIDGGQPVKGAWTLDDDALDASGNANHGTLNGGMGYTTGKFGQAGLFDGVDDYVATGTTGMTSGSSPFSIGVWMKKDVALGISHRRAISFGTDPSPPLGGVIWIGYYNGNINIAHYGVLTGVVSTSTGLWEHVFFVYDGTNYKLYHNGTYIGQYTYALDITPNKFWIGNTFHNPGENFRGIIDEVRIYNRALDQAEITDLYNNYGYVTTSYPGRELVRKYASPEPAVTATGQEEHSRKGGIIIY